MALFCTDSAAMMFQFHDEFEEYEGTWEEKYGYSAESTQKLKELGGHILTFFRMKAAVVASRAAKSRYNPNQEGILNADRDYK